MTKQFFLGGLMLMAQGCANYHLTSADLVRQFEGIDSTKLRSVTVRGPIGEHVKYLANPIVALECSDRAGNSIQLPVTPSVEMRVTTVSGKRSVFYFDRVFLSDSLLVGVQSRFVGSFRNTIPLKDITKIEVQDGKKNFKYVK